jgi:hypothetical protein
MKERHETIVPGRKELMIISTQNLKKISLLHLFFKAVRNNLLTKLAIREMQMFPQLGNYLFK